MNAETKFILNRLDKLRLEIKADIERAISETEERVDHNDKRITKLEKSQNRAWGAAIAIGGITSWISKHL